MSSDAVGRLPIKLVAPLTDWKEYFAPNIWHVRIDPADFEAKVAATFKRMIAVVLKDKTA